MLIFWTTAVLLETGHNISPLLMSWTHGEFRRVMLAHTRKFILIPIVVMLISMIIGFLTIPADIHYTLHTPWYAMTQVTLFGLFFWIYYVWQIYHFGMQNFGIAQLYRRTRRGRRITMGACLSVTTLGMVVPQIAIVISVHHWLAAIGLCSAVSRRAFVFIPVVLALGAIGFIWIVPTPTVNMVKVIPMALCLRQGLGICHYLYDRWVWKLSDPEVRATIGRDLLT